MATLVTFHAHPDDEAIETGGTMRLAAAAGHDVVLVTATRGECGEPVPGVLAEGEELWERRVAETHAAAEILGATRVEFLGYRDSGMMGEPTNDDPACFWQADVEEAAGRLASILRDVGADVLTIYDDHGGYGHPDHIKLHQATMRAYELLYGIEWKRQDDGLWAVVKQSRPAPRLYFAVIPKGLVRLGVRILPLLRQDPRRFGRNKDIDLVQIASWEVPITTRIDTRRYFRIKQAASACHASQQPPAQQSRIVRFLFRRNQSTEYFARAYPPYQRGERRETGLFGD